MRFAALTPAVLALALTASASAVGPSLPDVNGAVSAGEVSFVVHAGARQTTLTRRVEGRAVARTALTGGFGLPMTTLAGGRGGLSTDGRTLVLGSNVRPDGTLRTRSRFVVVDAGRLAVSRTITLQGDYSFDALSPQGRWLYLIRHVPSTDNRYQVKAYDLRKGALLPGVIYDRQQPSWVMSGYPVARVTSPGGRWVYTLYQQPDSYPFVHALDTVKRSARCIDLTWAWGGGASDAAISRARMTLEGRTLGIAAGPEHFAIDTKTFAVR